MTAIKSKLKAMKEVRVLCPKDLNLVNQVTYHFDK